MNDLSKNQEGGKKHNNFEQLELEREYPEESEKTSENPAGRDCDPCDPSENSLTSFEAITEINTSLQSCQTEIIRVSSKNFESYLK